MRLSPAMIQSLVAVASEVEAAGRGGKGAVYDRACKTLGIGRATLMRYLKEVTMAPQRKKRSDAGSSKIPSDVLQMVSAALMEGYRNNDKKLMSVQNAIDTLVGDGKIPPGRTDTETGEISPWSDCTLRRALRQRGLHPEQLRRPAPAMPQKSAHPNDVWQIDASISTLFYVPESGLADMPPGEFYKNKPGNFEKIKRQRLTRYVITDHCSGAIFVHYVAGGESIVNMTDSFLRAIVARPDQQLYGVPFYLMMDPGGDNTVVRNLLRRLQVEPIVNKAGNARAKGQVENAHNIVECNFEIGFKFGHVPDIAWINRQAARWMRWYNSVKVHGRHGLTRYQKWMEIKPDELRVIAEDIDLKALVFGKPERRKVNQWCQVEFGNANWKVGHVPGVRMDEWLDVAVNPFDPASLFAVVTDPGQRETLIPLERVELDEHGFQGHAAHIGREYKRHADTVLETNRKAIERFATGAETDESAEAARKAKKLPFGGAVDAYKYLDNLPNVEMLPRRGTALDVATQTAAAPERRLSGFEAAAELARRGVEMNPEKNRLVAQWYPEGVPESELEALQHRLSVRASLRVVGG